MEFYKTKKTKLELEEEANIKLTCLLSKIKYIEDKINIVKDNEPLMVAYYIQKIDEGIDALTFHHAFD